MREVHENAPNFAGTCANHLLIEKNYIPRFCANFAPIFAPYFAPRPSARVHTKHQIKILKIDKSWQKTDKNREILNKFNEKHREPSKIAEFLR